MKKGLRTYNPAGMRSRKGILRSKILNLADKMAFVIGSGGGMGQAMAVTLISDKDYMPNALQKIPAGRAGETHGAVDSAVFLASAASDFIQAIRCWRMGMHGHVRP
jgi:hypothetical protein